MNSYLEKICFFFFIGDFLGHFWPGESYEKYYRMIFGILGICVLLSPIFKISIFQEKKEALIQHQFEELLDDLEKDVWETREEQTFLKEKERLEQQFFDHLENDDLDEWKGKYGYGDFDGEEAGNTVR